MNTCSLNLSEAVSTTRIRTLVVDNSPMMLKLCAQVLKEAGNFELVGTATDGSQALRQASAVSPDLVLMDLHLPHVNGILATRYLKERERPPIVILIASDKNSLAKTMAKNAGADGFVSKEANLRLRLIGVLQNLFATNSEWRSVASDTWKRAIRKRTSSAGAGFRRQGHLAPSAALAPYPPGD